MVADLGTCRVQDRGRGYPTNLLRAPIYYGVGPFNNNQNEGARLTGA